MAHISRQESPELELTPAYSHSESSRSGDMEPTNQPALLLPRDLTAEFGYVAQPHRTPQPLSHVAAG